MLTAVIVEDEKRSRESLVGLLKLYCKNVSVLAEADGVKTGIEAIAKNNPDIVFLGMMPDNQRYFRFHQLTKAIIGAFLFLMNLSNRK